MEHGSKWEDGDPAWGDAWEVAAWGRLEDMRLRAREVWAACRGRWAEDMLLRARGARADPEALKLREAPLLRGGVWLDVLLLWESVHEKPAGARSRSS